MSVYRKKFEQIGLQFETDVHLTIASSIATQQAISDAIVKTAQ